MFWKRSLLAQLVSYFSILSIVTLILVAIAAYQRAQDSIELSLTQRLTVATTLKEFQLNEWVNNQRRDVLFISQLSEVRERVATLVTEDSASPEFKEAHQALSDYLTQLSKVKSNIQNVVITTNGGIVVFSLRDRTMEGQYRPLGEPTTYFTRQNADVVVPNFYLSPSTGKAAITFGTPLLDAKEVQMAAIMIDLDLGDIDRLIRENTGLGNTAETYLAGRAGDQFVFIARGDAPQSSTQPNSAPNVRIYSPGIAAASSRNYAEGTSRNYADVPVIGVYRWLTRQNLVLVAEITQQEAFQPAQTLSKEIFLIGLSSAGLLLVAVYLLSRRITLPILAITNTAIDVTQGNLSRYAPVLTEDEIGLLAKAFNQMMRQLKQKNQQLAEANQTLENRVVAATDNLQDTLAYLTSIIDNMADGLVATDRNGLIYRWNPPLLKMFNVSPEQIQGRRCEEVLGEDWADLILTTLASPRLVQTAEVRMAEGRIGKASATAIQVEESIHPDSDQARTQNSGTYLGTIVLVQDITTAKEIDRMKTDFISTVSHELRTPLTSVLGFAKIIKKKFQDSVIPVVHSDDPKIRRNIQQINANVDVIVEEGERLTTLINDLLDLAKLEAGRVDWNMDMVSIEEIVERALTATSALFEQKQLTIHRYVQSDLPFVMGDRDRLIQVVINLISNAVKFTTEGSITCQAELQDQSITVSVTDSGIGIAEADQPKVFEKFRQVGDTLVDKPTGSGLGLPISKEIIEHHNGQIWVESTLGEGSTFSFSLPLTSVPLMTPQNASLALVAPDATDSESEGQIIHLDQLLQEMRQKISPLDRSEHSKTILVVDDDANIRKLLRYELETEGYRVEEASNGMIAITQVKTLLPDLVILDIIMPDLSGFDVAATIRKHPTTCQIPLIVLSSFEDRDQGLQSGIDCYLRKPLDIKTLIREVEKLIDSSPTQKIILIGNDVLESVTPFLTEWYQQGYSVLTAHTQTELIEKLQSLDPKIVIASNRTVTQQEIMQVLQSEVRPENLYFLQLADQEIAQIQPEEDRVFKLDEDPKSDAIIKTDGL